MTLDLRICIKFSFFLFRPLARRLLDKIWRTLDNVIHVAHYPNSGERNRLRGNIRLREERRRHGDDVGATLIGNLVYGDAGHRM